MSKLATKKPKEIRSILVTSDTEAEVYYAKPVQVGKIYFRNGSWYTPNGLRFAAARDAMGYLINLHELGQPVPLQPAGEAVALKLEAPMPTPQQAPKRNKLRGATDAREITVKSLIKFLRENPDIIIKP